MAVEDETGDPDERNHEAAGFTWRDEDADALRQARRDAELTASADGLRALLQQIREVSPLAVEEEAHLAGQIAAGRRARAALADTTGSQLPTEEQRRELAQICRDGDRAEQALRHAHTDLIVAVATCYTGLGTAFLDLVAIGDVGLAQAARKFDGTKGYRFAPYATWWIRQAITRAMTA